MGALRVAVLGHCNVDMEDIAFDDRLEGMEVAYAMTTLEQEVGNSANEDVDGRQSLRRDERDEEEKHGGDNEANLNMCSAYTHVFVDTLRSLAVIIAATVAHLAHEVTSEEADATAAIVVSALILFSLFPLLSGLVSTCRELRSIHADERDEHKSREHRD
ncbi:Cation efflux family [Fragilaria crotonensis]|nr:Cation efflux family [Fragilaria crotonensis]